MDGNILPRLTTPNLGRKRCWQVWLCLFCLQGQPCRVRPRGGVRLKRTAVALDGLASIRVAPRLRVSFSARWNTISRIWPIMRNRRRAHPPVRALAAAIRQRLFVVPERVTAGANKVLYLLNFQIVLPLRLARSTKCG